MQPLSIGMPAAVSAAAADTGQAGSTASTQAQMQQLTKIYEEMITSGAKRTDYKWLSKPGDGAETSIVHVIEVDLTNPYVKLGVMNGTPGSVTGVGSVGSMVSSSGAVAGVNADFFDTTGKGVPLGAEVNDGVLQESPSKLKGMYAFAVTKDRKPMIDLFDFSGTVTALDGTTFPLAGINKAAYRTEPDNGYSHANAIYIYTSAWTAPRPDVSDSSTTPTEVLVENGIVTQIVQNGMIPGPVPADGYILRTHGTAAQFALQHLQIGQPVTANYTLVSQTTGQQVDPSTLQMLVGGHTILVDGGKAAAFSRDTRNISGSADRARTAVGYSQDGKKAYIMTVENSDNSEGVTLTELQKIMIQLGIWKGVDLDGGGSTTMITRPLGEFNTTLTHDTEYGTVQRKVASGLGVFTTAPQGPIKGITISGPDVLFIGEQADYEMKAFDTYYNPVDPGAAAPVWKAASPLGYFGGGTFAAVKPGKTTITVKSGSASDSMPIEIIGGDQIAQMSIDASSPVLEAGKSIAVPVSVTLNDGRRLDVPASSLKWELHGFSGTVQDGTLTINSIDPNATTGYAIARYDGFSAVAVLGTGTDKLFENFEQPTYPISFQNTNGVKGSASIVSGLQDRPASSVLQLQYDFTGGSGTKAAYAVLGGSGRKIDGAPSAMTVDVLGDNSLNWVRAEFVDNKGKSQLVTLADQVDWSGWKTIKVNLPSTAAYPVTLKRLYVASLAEGQDERALTGQIDFDNISFQYAASIAEPHRASIMLTIGSKTAKVDGQPYKLDVTPLLVDGTTYLPLRFVTEAMGAQVGYEPVTKRVSVLRGDKLLELRIGQKDVISNGIRLQSEVAPMLKGGRTLVPIRLVSEQLGFKVSWDGKLDRITVQ